MINSMCNNIALYFILSGVNWIFFNFMFYLTNFITFLPYEIRQLIVALISYIILFVSAYFISKAYGSNLTAKGFYNFKDIVIYNLIAAGAMWIFAAVFAFSPSEETLIYHIQSFVFYLGQFPGYLFNNIFVGALINIPIVFVIRLFAVRAGYSYMITIRPSLKDLQGTTNKDVPRMKPSSEKTWRNSIE